MVDPDSGRVPRAPPYSGYCQSPLRFGYVDLTLYVPPSHAVLLLSSFLSLYAVLQPRLMRFGLLPFRSPLLGESLLISVPVLLRWFTSHSIAPVPYVFRYSGNSISTIGLLHSEIRGLTVMCTLSRLIAAYHVLHRLREPRHPPYALSYFL